MIKLLKVRQFNNDYIAYIGSESEGVQVLKVCNSNYIYKVITDLGAHTNVSSFTFANEKEMIKEGFKIVG